MLPAECVLHSARFTDRYGKAGSAAGIWMTAAIGVACGLGRESTAVLSTLLALAVLAVLPRLVGRDNKR